MGSPATVRLTADQQHQIGLQTAVLEAAPHPEQFRAYGAVLDVARITDLTNSYANAQAQLQTAQAKFDVAKSAFERAQNLVHSAILAKRDAEAAEGTFRTDQASLTAAESQVKTLAATARQEWGPVIGKGIVERSPEVVQLIERDQFLVQVTLPPGVVLAEPPGLRSRKRRRGMPISISTTSRQQPEQTLGFRDSVTSLWLRATVACCLG